MILGACLWHADAVAYGGNTWGVLSQVLVGAIMAERSNATMSEFPSEDLSEDADEGTQATRGPRAPQMQRLGRYRLVREIASGGMASVNLAVADGVDKLVALKMIHAHLAQEDSFVQMFLDEARIASAISHRNVCNVFDFGEVDGRFFIAMDFLSGQSLRDVIHRLRKTPDLAPPERLSVFAATIIGEACEGLHAAHELRDEQGKPLEVVHRDVSPHNLFVSYDGSVSVVDFGIARAADRIQQTATGVLKGKFSYMAPEQIRQIETDRKADVWALGVCLWETLTLQRLFVRSNQADTLMSVMMDRVKSPSEVYPGIPAALDAIVMRALARNPAQRYPTARELGRDLAKFVRDSGQAMDSVEIEQWLARLFPAEIEENRRLLRNARIASMEDSQLLDGTPSGFARAPTRSGAMLRARSSITPSVSGVSDPAGLILDRPPDNDQSGSQRAQMAPSQIVSRRRRGAHKLIALVIALGLGTFAGLVTLTPPPASPVAATVTSKPDSSVRKQEVVSQVGTLLVEPQVPEVSVVTAPIAEPPSTNMDPVSPPNVQNQEEGTMRSAVGEKTRITSSAARSASARRATVTAPERMPVAAATEAHAPDPTVPALNQPSPGGAVVPATGYAASDALRAAFVPGTPEPKPESSATPRPAATAAPAIVAPQTFDAVSRVSEVKVDGSLGTGVVGRMLSRAEPLLRQCYATAAKRSGKNQYVPMSMALTIDETGAVRQIEAGKHPLSGLSDCVAGEFKRLRSDRKPDVGTVQVRFSTEFKAP